MPDTEFDSEHNYDASKFERPSVTTDMLVFTIRERRLHVLLIQRKAWPFANQWALPGGFVRPGETLDEAARRELQEETGLSGVYLAQLKAYGDPNRDPRTWVITIAYTALIPSDKLVLRADTDAVDARWFPVYDLPKPLAFDHAVILDHAIVDLREKLETSSTIARALLPVRFTLSQMQEVYEIMLGVALDKRNFRKWIANMGIVIPTDQEMRGQHRPALLYEFVTPGGQAGQEIVHTNSPRGLRR